MTFGTRQTSTRTITARDERSHGGASPDRNRGQSMSALPGISDLDLLREGEGIVHLDPEIAYGAFHSRVPEQELYGT